MRKRDFFHTGLDVSRSECQLSRLNNTQIFGDTYVVDGSNGKDGNDGNIYSPFETVQKAITVQIANNSGLGDRIWIMPGDYVENLTGALTGVELLGAGFNARMVNIKPVTGNGYAGVVTNSIISGISFWEPTGAGGTAAVAISQLIGGTIGYCRFVGTTGHAESTGLRIGTEVTPIDYEQMIDSLITRNMFSHSGGRTKEFGFGINFGLTGAATQSATRIFAFSEISYNQIFAEYSGIRLYVDAANGGGQINNNTIGSRQNTGETSQFGIDSRGDSTDLLTKVLDNRVAASVDAIFGFSTSNVMGNIVSAAAGAPTSETGQ